MRKKTLPFPWDIAERRAGGRAALAEMLGCSPETMRRWIGWESRPSKAARLGLKTCFAALGLPYPFAVDVADALPKVKVTLVRGEDGLLYQVYADAVPDIFA